MLKINQRNDQFIHDDIRRAIINYPPTANDRLNFNYSVIDGIVYLSGYVRTEPTATYLINQIQMTDGVIGLETDGFYTDEGLRFEVGRVIPFGVQVRVEYGNVILAGRALDKVDMSAVLQAVSQVKGVQRVIDNTLKS